MTTTLDVEDLQTTKSEKLLAVVLIRVPADRRGLELPGDRRPRAGARSSCSSRRPRERAALDPRGTRPAAGLPGRPARGPDPPRGRLPARGVSAPRSTPTGRAAALRAAVRTAQADFAAAQQAAGRAAARPRGRAPAAEAAEREASERTRGAARPAGTRHVPPAARRSCSPRARRVRPARRPAQRNSRYLPLGGPRCSRSPRSSRSSSRATT